MVCQVDRKKQTDKRRLRILRVSPEFVLVLTTDSVFRVKECGLPDGARVVGVEVDADMIHIKLQSDSFSPVPPNGVIPFVDEPMIERMVNR